ncbi:MULTISPECIES: thiamine phosphate synthase [Flavobacterium]|uniref:thiamine phosphate synthase n=1 Tax=Flavobacterium TaxID=237 RepID=UPI0013D5DDC1|nr:MULTISPECIES: thiamine phosphate synthase [Flavobacterium]MCJ1807290.1 thiamine phosphate synthase [Flavobacterium covae]
MILLSTEHIIENEIQTLHQLFEAGLTHFHIRKPNYTLQETKAYLEKIDTSFHPFCVVYYPELVNEYDLKGIHQTNQNRNSIVKNTKSLSTSTHSISEFNELDSAYHYAFLSPIFPSISKANYQNPEILHQIAQRTNFNTQLIALGGISEKNISEVLPYFNSVALLGAIWLHPNPIEQWKKCRNIVLSYSV